VFRHDKEEKIMKKKKKKIIYILVYNEWDGGGGDITENIIASLNVETIVAYKVDLERWSAVIQHTFAEWEVEKNNKLKPLWEELHPILQSLRQSNAIKMDPDELSKAVAERGRLTNATGLINNEYYQKKENLISNLGVEYYIEDPALANFVIEELEVI
jgi:hypothetical protein